jgi:sugar O-acyltransferase (sialic acid O-acetyltransferase NeuD family)
MEINPVIIMGAKGLGKAALEIFKSNEVVVYGFLDDDTSLHQTEIDEVMVLGKIEDDGFLKLIGQKCDAFVAIDENKYRQNLVKMLNDRRHLMPTNAIHKQAWIAQTAQIGYGNFINAGVNVGAFAKIGQHCLVHTGAIIDFEAEISDFAQIGAGSIIGAGAKIGEGVFIGSGVTIVPGLEVGKNARIGAGSVVIEPIKAGATVFGNPAKTI